MNDNNMKIDSITVNSKVTSCNSWVMSGTMSPITTSKLEDAQELVDESKTISNPISGNSPVEQSKYVNLFSELHTPKVSPTPPEWLSKTENLLAKSSWKVGVQFVNLIKSHEDAKLPYKATKGAACSDLYSVENTSLQPGETKLISTGLKVAHIPTGFRLSIFDRSGFRAKGIFGSSVGIIDEDYRGELKVILFNSARPTPWYKKIFGIKDKIVEIKSGDRIAQMCLEEVQPVEYSFTETFEDTERGEGGFGSTNLKT